MSSINVTNSIDGGKNLFKAFDDAKTGVKGLVDAGVKKVPQIFVRSVKDRSSDSTICNEKKRVPIIDFSEINAQKNNNVGGSKIVEEVVKAGEKWGFFQVVNHGIPLEVLDNMIGGIKEFNEQDSEAKKEYYSRDRKKAFTFHTNNHFNGVSAASWRDSLSINTLYAGQLDANALPPICRDAIVDYSSHVQKFGDTICDVLSVGLGLKPDYLREIECPKAWIIACNYYPLCPEPNLTLGMKKHSDPSFFTVLTQNQISGLQVLHEEQWVNLDPVPGALTVIIGDMLQMISNDRLKSVWHRVIANDQDVPRISAAFLFTGYYSSERKYGPIKELISDENPAVFRDFTIGDFVTKVFARQPDEPGYARYKIQKEVM